MTGSAAVRKDIERLRRTLAAPETITRLPPGGGRQEAAVLVPLIEHASELRVVYIRRSEHVENHSGQIAFPGGRAEPPDTTLLQTALREAKEEVGINPASVDLLGCFPVMNTMTTRFAVAPFVGLLAGEIELRPDPREVAEIFEAPLAALAEPRNRGIYEWRREERARSIYHPAIFYRGHAIWGLTWRITQCLLGTLAAAD